MGSYTSPSLSRLIKISVTPAKSRSKLTPACWAATAPAAAHVAIASCAGTTLPVSAILSWAKPKSNSPIICIAWKVAAPQNPASLLLWGQAINIDSDGSRVAWEPGTPLTTRADNALSWITVFPLHNDASSRWRMISHQLSPITYRSWQGYRAQRRYGSVRGQDAALDTTAQAPWSAASTTATASKIPWGAGTRLWPPMTDAVWPSDTSKPGTPPPAPDIEDAYTMATDLTVTTYDPDNPETPGTPLKVDGVRLSLDLDSFAWSLTCRVLDAASMALCLPPALIKVSTMGYGFVFLCERYSTTYAVGTTWQLSGSSRTRQLDKPWATPTSHLETNAISFKQACEACLPEGFSIEWDSGIQDWSIPANGWSYNNQTPKGALADLLTAAGLVMIPDLAAPTLHIQPRYKRAPWEYADDEADAIIAEAMMLSESGDYQPGDTVNGVWISGTTDAGVIVEVTRSGTAGDQLAADQQHDVITDPVAGQQWGKQIIAAGGNKTLVTLETIITDEAASPGLLLPGLIVEVQTALETWRGLVLSCDLSNPGSPRITQTVTIERSGEAALS